MPHRFYTHGQMKYGDRHIYAPRTRFVPSQILGHFEASAWGSNTAAGTGSSGASRPQIDVGAKARAVWN